MNRFVLEMFTVVVEVKRVTSAARMLNITQPAVSQQIRHMEAYYGVPLLERGPHGVVPTPAGHIIYRHAKQILAQYECMEREIDDLTNADDREVLIGATPSVGNFALPCSLWTFKDKFPKANLLLEVGHCGEIIDSLLMRRVHLAIVEGPVPDRATNANGIKIRCISGDDLVLVTPTGSPWSSSVLTGKTLLQAPLILPGKGTGIRHMFDQSLEGQGIQVSDLKVMTQISTVEGMKSVLEAHGGVMLTTRMAVQKELRAETYKEVTPASLPMKLPFHLVCFEESLPPVARRFIRFIAAPEELASCWT